MDYLDYIGRVINKIERRQQIEELEKELGYLIPVSLKAFYLMYQVNDFLKYGKGDHLRFNYLVLNNLTNYKSDMALLVSNLRDEGYDPSTFFEFRFIKSVIRSFFNDGYSLYENDYIFVGETSWHFPLMIGINEDNSDKVYVYNLDKDKLIFIADNIFEYLMNIELDFSNNYNLPEGKTVNDLYKNWGEDFWRVRDE